MPFLRKVYRRGRHFLFMQTQKTGNDIRQTRQYGFDLIVRANENVGRDIILRDFENEETAFFRQHLKPDDCCFDIGGNVGYFSMLMASIAKNGAVHVFEPISLNVRFIELNAQINGFCNVIVNNCAVADKVGHTQFSVASDSAYSSIIGGSAKAEVQSIDVILTTIDTYVAQHGVTRVDVIKVDVEGAENLVVRGGKGLLTDRARRPRLVMLELFDPHLKRFDTSVANVVAKMDRCGYAAHILEHGALRPYHVDNGQYNLIFTPVS